LLAVAALDMIRRRSGVRRDYESIYSLGVAFAAYAAAEAVHGSGFLAAFTAGLTISVLDVELCDCFLEYGETTAEMALLFTFVLFGSSLIWSGLKVLGGATLLFAVAVLLVRPIAFLVSLVRTRLDRRGRLLIAWFGPRGLSSLLLILLPVFAGLPGSEQLFAVCCLVVLLSVVLHGGSLMLLGRGAPQVPDSQPAITSASEKAASPKSISLPVLPEGASDGQSARLSPTDGERISMEEVRRLQESGTPVIVLDVRTDRTYESGDLHAQGAIRLPPDQAVRRATELGLPRPAWLAAFCA
jgi:NhaP-type Na+/H+ or K+/H+ antiporter